MKYSRQEYWRGAIPFSKDLSNPGIKPGSSALQANILLSEPPGKMPINKLHTSVKRHSLSEWGKKHQFSNLFFFFFFNYKVKVLVAQSCLTLCNPVDCSLQVSPIHGIFQAKTVEWVVIPFSRGFSWSRNQTWVSALQADSLPSEPPGKLFLSETNLKYKNT